jgi:hypothetical protein
MATADIRAVTLALLASRDTTASVCPSEVARVAAGPKSGEASPVDWRQIMPEVHAEIDKLLAQGIVRLSWKGQPLQSRAGPYRINLATREES